MTCQDIQIKDGTAQNTHQENGSSGNPDLDPQKDDENIDKEGEKDEENKQDIEPEEEEEEEEKFENAVEAKDFQYFKSQCKFERFVDQLGTNSNKSKNQGALFSYFGSSLLSANT